MNQPPSGYRTPSLSTIIAGTLILILTVVTIIAGLTVLQPNKSVTELGDKTMALYQFVLWISLAIYLLVTNGIIWAVFRYKRRNNDIPAQIHGSNVLELTWTVIPVIILVALFIPSVLLVIDYKTPPDDDDIYVRIEAVGHQWWWEFIYPDGTRVQQTPPNYDDLVPPALVVPTGKTVVVDVKSADVVHSFYVPNTLYKVQAIPGVVNTMHFVVNEEGVFYGQCYQFCGVRHSDMLFVLDARSEADYLEWLEEQQSAQDAIGAPQGNSSTLVEGQ